jgi:terminal uridylyltransferase
MLRLYSELDPRVKTLGYVIKCFAKITDIGDAARGSLSSYAYILMLLYYLQQTNPPVVPCLQEVP